MKTSFRLLMSAVAVAFITLAASGAPLPFIDGLIETDARAVTTLAAPLAPGADNSRFADAYPQRDAVTGASGRLNRE